LLEDAPGQKHKNHFAKTKIAGSVAQIEACLPNKHNVEFKPQYPQKKFFKNFCEIKKV
jgi:hypothetical protein